MSRPENLVTVRRGSTLGRLAVALIVATVCWGFPSFGSAEAPALFDRASAAPDAPQALAAPLTSLRPAAEIDGAPVLVNAGAVAGLPATLRLELEQGRSLIARRTGGELRQGQWVTWKGDFAGLEDPAAAAGSGRGEVLLTVYRDRAVGRFVTPEGDLYSLSPTASGHRLSRLDPSAFQACGTSHDDADGVLQAALPGAGVTSGPRDLAPAPEAVENIAAAAAGEPIGILFLYSARARNEVGGENAIRAVARSGIDQLNSAFGRTGNNVSSVLHGVEEIPVPGSALDAPLSWLRGNPDAAARRERANADLVALILGRAEDRNGLCGVAYLMTKSHVGPQMARLGFSVTFQDCFPNLTFAHEIGHNMGAQHEPGENSGPASRAAFPYAYGHVVDGSFRTIMSYNTSCAQGSQSCPRQGLFSNPDRTVAGHPAGVPDQRDNRRVFSATVPIVAAFRAGGPPLPAGLARPTGLTAERVAGTEIALTWLDNAEGEQDYEVQARANGGAWAQVAVLPVDSTGASLTDLEPETEYTFRVRARGPGGVSGWSGQAAATTGPALPARPADPAAEALSASAVRLTWTGGGDGATGFEIELRTAASPPQILSAPAGAVERMVEGLAASTAHTLRVRAVNAAGVSEWSPEVNVTTGGADGACVADDTTLCLQSGRFEVRAAWRNPREPDDHGVGHALEVPGSTRTGMFWFFSAANVELVVKLLDGRLLNASYWHLYGALSDVEYWISVRDVVSGATRTYHNEPFAICGDADNEAFPDSPGSAGGSAPVSAVRLPLASASPAGPSVASAAATSTCEPGPTTHCLQDGRFRVEVDWVNPRVAGDEGEGRRAENVGTDRTGFFWFFRPDNLELVVKILDGRVVNGHFWLFWAGLSDVEYTLTVTDTETGAETLHTNPAFSICGGADTASL